jgi:DNA-binding NarL/FixJ family response regulator
MRPALRTLLERHDGWSVCGEASNRIEAVEQATDLKPDVVLLDIAMPQLDSLTAAPLILENTPHSHIIFLTPHHSLGMARIAATMGASAYITNSRVTRNLIPAIEADSKRELRQ